MKNKIKTILRSNPICCFFIYIIKYRIIMSIQFFLNYFLIKISPNAPQNADIQRYKNTKNGKSCIIIGNGPSVRMEDLNSIQKSGIDSFGANRILDILENTSWRPTYLCVMDPSFIISLKTTCTPNQYYNQIIKFGIENVFFNSMVKKYFKNTDRIHYIKNTPAIIFSKHLMAFSSNAARYISDLGSVTHFSIQLAYYMGYSTIYLYGMDNTYVKYLDVDGVFKINNDIESHVAGMKTNVDDEKKSEAVKTKYRAYQIGGYADKRKNDKGYMECKKFVEAHGFKIINLTHGGALDVFERQDFYSVFSK